MGCHLQGSSGVLRGHGGLSSPWSQLRPVLEVADVWGVTPSDLCFRRLVAAVMGTKRGGRRSQQSSREKRLSLDKDQGETWMDLRAGLKAEWME